ncbi:MAG TPA: RnfABCDGE type electron transport complex subunit D [Candidatus Eisenbacteria bacterium]|nr:RnfABCDGE type electron transport complex subunit D [Candidatus Eisenbacteria bacterium]
MNLPPENAPPVGGEQAAARPRTLVLAPGPHLHTTESTASIMWWVNGSLAPLAVWGAFVFGWNAVAVMAASIAGSVAAEWGALRLLRRRATVADGSAVCTGLLLSLTLPPLVPPWQALLGGAFAILVGKMIFGGLGYNLFNPALVGRAFMTASFPLAMSAGWAAPRPWFDAQVAAVTSATPLAALREQGVAAAVHLVPGNTWAGLALGFRPGSIGEVSIVLIAFGAALLVARGIIRLTIPLSVIAGAGIATAFSGAALLHMMSGGLWLGAFFMATDYVTSPTTRGGQIAFGLSIGLLTGIIRLYGGYPEGICYAILLANALVPAFNLWFPPRRVVLAGAPS